MPLTDLAIKKIKPGEKVSIHSDGGGLQLRVLPSGGKAWRLAYRHDGKQKTLPIGPYPAFSLADARKEREAAKALLARGIDPVGQRAADQQKSDAELTNTFAELAAEYIEKMGKDGLAARTIKKSKWLLSLALPDLGPLPITSIKPKQILAMLQKIEGRGNTQSAGRLRALIGAMYRLAIASDRAEFDPSAALKGALVRHVTVARPAVTGAKDFGELLRAVWGYSGSVEVANCLKLLALLAQRPGELRQAEWSEFDIEKAVWSVPAARMKMRLAHRVPLPRQAIELLAAHRQVARQSNLVFPSPRSAARPITNESLNAALRRMGYEKEEAVAHGFRSSFSTLANESGKWTSDAIERALAHTDSNSVRGIYDRGQRWEERLALAQWWADECDRLRGAA